MVDLNRDRVNERVRVLLVEPHDDDAALLIASLQGCPEIELERVASVEQALCRLEESRHDALLIDPMAPDVRGVETLTELLTIHPALAITLQSWVVDPRSLSRAIRWGAQDYITKHEAQGKELARALQGSVARARREALLRGTLQGAPSSLPRDWVEERLRQALSDADRRKTMVALCTVEMPDLADHVGRDGLGDAERLAIQVMLRLRAGVRKSDTVVQLGNQRFVLVIGTLTGQREVSAVIRRMLPRLREPFQLDGNERHIASHVGVALYPEDGVGPRRLIEASAEAARRALNMADEGPRFHRHARNAREADNRSLGKVLRRALERNEMEVHYQPKFDGESRRPTAVEALVRWNHPGGVMPPTQFLTVAEETGLILPLGEWVVREVCRQLRTWDGAGLVVPRAAINVSRQQLLAREFVGMLFREIGQAGISPERIELEINELALLANEERAAKVLRDLHEVGIHIVVDGFGIRSPLPSQLTRFPIDEIKIARDLVREMGVSEDRKFYAGMISVLQGLGHRVIAEGVESEGQLRRVIQLGCDGVQGYYLRKPEPAGELAEFLRMAPARAVEPGRTA